MTMLFGKTPQEAIIGSLRQVHADLERKTKDLGDYITAISELEEGELERYFAGEHQGYMQAVQMIERITRATSVHDGGTDGMHVRIAKDLIIEVLANCQRAAK